MQQYGLAQPVRLPAAKAPKMPTDCYEIELDTTKVGEFQVTYKAMKLDFLSRDTCRDFKKSSFQAKSLIVLHVVISLPCDTCHDFNTGRVTVSRSPELSY
jgi:hypothetical protein